ncbi:MAG: GspMb/PilO family protein [Phenylobacterium sp.]|nr:GspMb/PilO family protein [Phenylobacterium sp.]
MIGKGQWEPIDAAYAVAAGAAAALLLGLGLASVATPADFDERTARIAEQVEQAEALLRPVRDRGPFGAESLCVGAADGEAGRLDEQMRGYAGRLGLAVDAMEIRPEPVGDLESRVTPVRLRFTASGPYEGFVGLLALLGNQRPQLFVDSLDLTPKVSVVSLSMSGRVFCGA